MVCSGRFASEWLQRGGMVGLGEYSPGIRPLQASPSGQHTCRHRVAWPGSPARGKRLKARSIIQPGRHGIGLFAKEETLVAVRRAHIGEARSSHSLIVFRM